MQGRPLATGWLLVAGVGLSGAWPEPAETPYRSGYRGTRRSGSSSMPTGCHPAAERPASTRSPIGVSSFAALRGRAMSHRGWLTGPIPVVIRADAVASQDEICFPPGPVNDVGQGVHHVLADLCTSAVEWSVRRHRGSGGVGERRRGNHGQGREAGPRNHDEVSLTHRCMLCKAGVPRTGVRAHVGGI